MYNLNASAGTLSIETTVADVLDKGSGAVIILDGELFLFFFFLPLRVHNFAQIRYILHIHLFSSL